MNMSFESSANCIEVVFSSVLMLSMIGSFVAVVAIVLQKLLGRFISDRLMYFFWLLVICRFAMLVVPASPTSLLNLFTGQPGLAVASADSLTAFETTNEAPVVFPVVTTEGETEAIAAVPKTAVVWSVESAFWLTVSLVWSFGVGLCSIVLFVQAISLWRLVRSSKQLTKDSRLVRVFESARETLALTRSVELLTTDRIDVPAMVGWVRPKILVPEWCERHLDDRQLKLIFVHELIHVRRFDGWVQLFAHLVTIVHWFNPLVRLAKNQIAGHRELACDRQVVEALSVDSQEPISKLYARTILEIAAFVEGEEELKPGWVPGFIGRNKNLVVERIHMLNQPIKKSRIALVLSVVCVFALVAVGYTAAQVSIPLQDGGSDLSSPQEPVPAPQGLRFAPEYQLSAAIISPTEVSTEIKTEPNSPFAEVDRIRFKVQIFEGDPTVINRSLERCKVDQLRSRIEFDGPTLNSEEQKSKVFVVDRKFIDDLSKDLIDLSTYGTEVTGNKTSKFVLGNDDPLRLKSGVGPENPPCKVGVTFQPHWTTEKLILNFKIAQHWHEYVATIPEPRIRYQGLNSGVQLSRREQSVLVTLHRGNKGEPADKEMGLVLISPVGFEASDSKVADNVSSIPATVSQLREKHVQHVVYGEVEVSPRAKQEAQPNVLENKKNPKVLVYKIHVHEGPDAETIVKKAFGELESQVSGVYQLGTSDGAKHKLFNKMLDQNRFRLISRPTITCLPELKARFLAGSEVAAETLVVQADGSKGKGVEFIPLGLQIELTPTYRDGKLITFFETRATSLVDGQPAHVETIKDEVRLKRPNLNVSEMQATAVTPVGSSFVFYCPKALPDRPGSNHVMIVSVREVELVAQPVQRELSYRLESQPVDRQSYKRLDDQPFNKR